MYSYNTFHSPAELGNPVVVYAFQGHLLYNFRLSCHLITSGISVLLSVGRNMTGNTIRRMKLLVLKSMHISIRFGIELATSSAVETGSRCRSHTFSNGNTHYPNGGLNVIGGRIGVVRTFGEEDASTDVPNAFM